MRNIVYISFLSLFLQFPVHAQSVIKGVVRDASNQQPLPGVSIAINDTAVGFSNEKGDFELSVQSDALLHFSYVGYESSRLQFKEGKFEYEIHLKPGRQNLEEVVVSGFLTREKLLNTPGPVSLVTSQDIERDNMAHPQLLMNRVPGVYMHSGAYNTNRITIRGIGGRSLFSTNRVKSYLNEIPLSTGEGETIIEDIDLRLIDRMEIIKGPSSSIYGAGLGGTINLKAARPDVNQNYASSEWMMGSFGLMRNVNQVNLNSEKSQLILGQTNMLSDGWRENNQYGRHSFYALGQLYPSEKSSVTVLAHMVRMKGYIPSSIDSVLFRERPQAAAANWLQAQGFEEYERGTLGFTYDQEIHDNFRFSSTFFTNFRNTNEPRPFDILRETFNAHGLRQQFFWTPERWAFLEDVAFGTELFREFYKWNTYENNNRQEGAILSDTQENRNYYNIFLQARWRLLSKLTMTTGLNLNETDYRLKDLFLLNDIDQSGRYGFDAVLSPRVALMYNPIENMGIHASVSHGFSPPSVAETLTPSGMINTELQPETGISYELGIRGSAFERRLTYDASFYSMQIQNLIVARRVAEDQFVGINAGATVHNGMEYDFSYRLSSRESAFQWQLFTRYALQLYRFEEFIDGERDFSGNQLTGTPRQVFNSGLDFSHRAGWYGTLNYQFVDRIPILDDNSVYSDAYQLWNLKIGYQNTFFSHFQLDCYAGINNLLDEQYASMVLVNAGTFGAALPRYYYPGMPRNFFSGISLRYNF